MADTNVDPDKVASREKLKLALIPVLVLVLAVVLYSQMNPEEVIETVAVDPGAKLRKPINSTSNSADLVSNQNNEDNYLSLEREWLETPLDRIVKHDPFVNR
ncbi:MAG: hypothetical protein R3C11_22975 [Planctomycetaceae bacterium]